MSLNYWIISMSVRLFLTQNIAWHGIACAIGTTKATAILVRRPKVSMFTLVYAQVQIGLHLWELQVSGHIFGMTLMIAH